MKKQPNQATVMYQGWQKLVKQYQQPDIKISTWQIINSVGGLILCWILMYLSMNVSYWLTLLISIPAAGFVVRIFIIQHDCGHGSFFKSRKANDWVGFFCGVLTYTPYTFWRKTHAIHHKYHAELEERRMGDIWMMTVEEYQNAPRYKRLYYRIYRNPIFLFVLTPTLNFVVVQRFPVGGDKKWKNGETASVYWTNFALLIGFVGFGIWLGFVEVLLIQLPIITIAAVVGTWLFYVQHQFENTYWEHSQEWDYTLAALHGSSYYKLPRVLQWFSGNIGFHHIHHLSPRIPNYKLEACYVENPMFQEAVQLTLWQSFKTVSFALWDEGKQRLVSFREAKQGLQAAN